MTDEVWYTADQLDPNGQYVAVVDCSLPVDDPNHVRYRNLTDEELLARHEATQEAKQTEPPRDIYAEVDQIKEHLGL